MKKKHPKTLGYVHFPPAKEGLDKHHSMSVIRYLEDLNCPEEEEEYCDDYEEDFHIQQNSMYISHV